MIIQNSAKRNAMTLLDTMLSAVLAVMFLIPTINVSRLAVEQQRRSSVREEMAVRGEATIDTIRIALGDPAVFSSASAGVLPSGIPADQTTSFLPGEAIRQRVTITPYDLNRDLLTIDVILDHQTSGMSKLAPQVRFVTQIAEPW